MGLHRKYPGVLHAAAVSEVGETISVTRWKQRPDVTGSESRVATAWQLWAVLSACGRLPNGCILIR